MPLIEDDELVNPSIAEAQMQYVLSLPDTHRTYTRFISALLIPRPSHAAFFRDLRSFRSQPTIISLLSTCDASQMHSSKENIKESYRKVTQSYLQSRWSHPWCRKAGGLKDNTACSTGWWGAQWTATGRKMSHRDREEENKLHTLLLPIWVIMRGRMFPGEGIVSGWWTNKQEEEERRRLQTRPLDLNEGVQVWLNKLDAAVIEHGDFSSAADEEPPTITPSASQNPFGGEVSTLRPVKTVPNLRQDFWDSIEAQDLQRDLKKQEEEAAHAAAASVFRLAATGMLLSSVPKWKLKRLIKVKS